MPAPLCPPGARSCVISRMGGVGGGNRQRRTSGHDRRFPALCCKRATIMIEKPRFRLRDLTDREQRLYAERGYIKFEPYPARFVDKDGVTGKFWTRDELDET